MLGLCELGQPMQPLLCPCRQPLQLPCPSIAEQHSVQAALKAPQQLAQPNPPSPSSTARETAVRWAWAAACAAPHTSCSLGRRQRALSLPPLLRRSPLPPSLPHSL